MEETHKSSSRTFKKDRLAVSRILSSPDGSGKWLPFIYPPTNRGILRQSRRCDLPGIIERAALIPYLVLHQIGFTVPLRLPSGR